MDESGDVAKYQQYFERFAVDGQLDKQGFRSVLQCLEIDPPQRVVDDMFAEHDKDESSQLSQDEFYEWIKDRLKSKSEMRDSLMQSLDILFPGTDRVPIDDLLAKLSELGETFDETEAAYARMTLEEFDSNNDGAIDKSELMNCFYSDEMPQEENPETVEETNEETAEETVEETKEETQEETTEETKEETVEETTEETQEETTEETKEETTEETQEVTEETTEETQEVTEETTEETQEVTEEKTEETTEESKEETTEETQEVTEEKTEETTEESKEETAEETQEEKTEETQETTEETPENTAEVTE